MPKPTHHDDDSPPEHTQKQPRKSADLRPQPPLGGYQEGSVESVGGGPSGSDDEERTGQSGRPPAVPPAPQGQRTRDAFTSSEVAEQSARALGRPARTRS